MVKRQQQLAKRLAGKSQKAPVGGGGRDNAIKPTKLPVKMPKSILVKAEDLDHLDGIERLLAKVTVAALAGEIALEQATKLGYLLDRLAKTKIEREKMKLMGELGAPFTGLTLVFSGSGK